MTLQEAIQKRSQLIKELNELTKKADAEKRDFNSDEEKEFNDKEAEANQLTKKIDREQRMMALEGEAGKGGSSVHYEPAGETRAHQEKQTVTDPKKQWRNFGEFLRAVVDAGTPGRRVDNRLMDVRAVSGMSEAVSSDGGFLVQTDFASGLLQRVYAKGVLASKVRRIPISANANGLKMNAIDETSRATGSRYGGVQAYWAAEAGTVSAKKPKFRQIELGLHKLMGLCYITDELMSDSVALDAVISDAFVNEFAFTVDDAILRGDGAGKPLGILNSNALVTVSKEGSQSADTVQKENLVKMRSRLWAPSRANSVWFINQDVEPQLNLLTLGDLGAYFPAGTFANQPYDQLFGRPVVAIEQCSTLGDVGDIVLADLNEYVMIDKGSIDAQSSIHVRFLYDEMAFRFTYRVDGQPMWSSTLTPYKGSNTLSPFITLEAR